MKTRRVLTVVSGVLVLSAMLVLANYGGGAQAAPKDGGGEGNHTLRWDTNNPSATRFSTAFPRAVLDKNTGLVWEQAPDATLGDWPTAIAYCINKNVGGTVGWRLPSVVELKSVQDPSLAAPHVPASAFPGVVVAGFWSATTVADDPTNAWLVLPR